MDPMKAVIARGLSKTYHSLVVEPGFAGSLKALFRGRRVEVPAVQEIDLEIESGEVVGFIGPNGAGKTTTLKMLSGILHPTAGSVEVLGHLPFRRQKEFLKSIALVTGQRSRLFWDLPAEEYFEFCRVVYEIPRDLYRRNREELIDLAEIGDVLHIPQRKLSAGQRKRCELAAALLHEPRVIFLDEPTNALDLVNARRIREFLRARGKEGNCAVILTSHAMADIEEVCGRIVVINAGRIVHDGSIRDLYQKRGARKQVRVVFAGPWDPVALGRIAPIRSSEGQEALLEIEPDRAPSVAAEILARFPVKDIEVRDLPLERVVEDLYR